MADRIKLPSFDVGQWLTSHHVDWSDEAGEVTNKCVGVRCPYCDDSSYHCGIFRDDKNFKCFRCGESGPFWKLTSRLLHLRRDELIEELTNAELTPLDVVGHIESILRGSPDAIETPQREHRIHFPRSKPLRVGQAVPTLIEQFLLRRRFTIEDCQRHRASYCIETQSAHYKRLLLPVVQAGRIITFQSRLLTKNGAKYLGEPGLAKTLYGEDRWRGELLVVVEGPLDVWRMGRCSVGTFGTAISTDQKHRLIALRPKSLAVVFDEDAFVRSIDLARELQAFIPSVRVACLPEGKDPDSMGREATMKIIWATSPLD